MSSFIQNHFSNSFYNRLVYLETSHQSIFLISFISISFTKHVSTILLTVQEPSKISSSNISQSIPVEILESQDRQPFETSYTRYKHRASTLSGEQVENGQASDYIVVSFDGDDDPANPKNWTLGRKVRATLLAMCAGIVGGWTSANDSIIITQAQKTFGVSDVTESLSTGLYLISFGLGSLISGPFSETVGRNPVYLIALILLMICIMISGLAGNIGTQPAFRFLAGWFGCTAVTTFAGTIADLWSSAERAAALTVPFGITFCAIFVSPVVGAFIGQSSVSWRWTEWVALIMAGTAFTLLLCFEPETYAPTILSWKASILRKETGNPRYRSEHELALESLWRRLLRSVYRPFSMLVSELSVVLWTLYLTVLYIVCFTFLTGYTFIYGDIYHMFQGSVGLCFLALDVGIIIIMTISIPIYIRYNKNLRAANTRGQESLVPEERLWLAIISAPCLPIGIFWMAWTTFRSISYWSSLVASALIGIAFLGITLTSYSYMIDVFEAYAASAISIGAAVRYVAAGVMVPVSIPMYRHLGVHWSLTLLGCLILLLTPVPIIMYIYGEGIRKKSRVANKNISVSENSLA
jgi:MFS family permease